MSTLLEVSGLSKTFGSFHAVNGVSFKAKRGEVIGFLGPNGAGKSTTMKMITGFLESTDGTVLVNGNDISDKPTITKQTIGYLPEGAPAYDDMTVAAYLNFIADIRSIDPSHKEERIRTSIEQLALQPVLEKPIETLSKGYKRRVGLAQAILHDPDILILDEPTDGLDPNQKHQVRNLLNKMAKDKLVIVSTHILEEVEAICSRVIMIAQGKVVVDETPSKLEARSKHHNAVSLRLDKSETKKVQDVLSKLPAVSSVELEDQSNGTAKIIAFPKGDELSIEDVRSALNAKRIKPDEIFIERGRLDDVFRKLTNAA